MTFGYVCFADLADLKDLIVTSISRVATNPTFCHLVSRLHCLIISSKSPIQVGNCSSLLSKDNLQRLTDVTGFMDALL